MAEYITKDEILWRMNNSMNKQDVYSPNDFKEMVIDECNVENVVEQSNLDKAIEEIEFLRQHRAKYITEDNKICIDSGEVLKILRNIEE